MFVGHRVAEIQHRTDVDEAWKYVPTRDNPADLSSRPIYLTEDPSASSKVRTWLRGPPFLVMDSSSWPPRVDVPEDNLEPDPEVRAPVRMVHSTRVECGLTIKHVIEQLNMTMTIVFCTATFGT